MEAWFKKSSQERVFSVEGRKERMNIRDFDSISSPQEFLKAVDFKILNGIFDELADRTLDNNPAYRSQHRIEPSMITFPTVIEHEKRKVLGRAYVGTGFIELLWEFHEGDTLARADAIQQLHTLVHEATHIRGGFDHSESIEWNLNNDRPITFVSKLRIGLGESSDLATMSEHIETTQKGISLNEAVTENIGAEVLREYLIRTGNSSYLRDEDVKEGLGYGAYFRERFVLSFVLEKLSNELEMPVAELWKGLAHAYINGNQDVIGLMTQISESIQKDGELMTLLQGLIEESKSEQAYANTLEQISSVPEVPSNTLNLFKRRRIQKKRIEAIKKRVDAMDLLKFDANALGDALQLRK